MTPSSESPSFDWKKFENALQIGGIRTGSLDAPGAGGSAAVRAAFIDTGAGLRFTVALERGGDIVDAAYNDLGLAYLSPNGLRPPSPAYHQEAEWLRGWAGGLLTTCGPEYMGGPRVENGARTSLHGRFSSSPAVIETLRNPHAHEQSREMTLGLVVRDSRVFGPVFEVRRTYRCTLGVPVIFLEDEVINVGDTPSAHHWLYHCNLGYPLLDEGAQFIYRGRAQYWVVPPPAGQDILQPIDVAALNRLKQVPGGLAEHAGSGERGLIVHVEPDQQGNCRVGLINRRRQTGLEFTYPAVAFPRLAHWQHYGPRGSFVSGLEPFYGSLLGSARDRHPSVNSTLAPGESRKYQVRIRVLRNEAELQGLEACDGPLQALA
jgi:hypothetical protein